MDFFISYRRNGGFLFSSRLYSELSALGFRVFWDIKKMKSGRFDKQIHAQLCEAACVIAVCSAGMFIKQRQSDWVAEELLTARSLNKQIIVVVLKGVCMDSVGFPACLDFLHDQPRIDLNTVTISEGIDQICCMASGINPESIRQTYSTRSNSDAEGKPGAKAEARLHLLSCPALQKESRHAAVTELLYGDHGSVPIYIDLQTVPISDRCYRTGVKNNRIIPGIIASDIRHIPLHSISDGMKRAVEVAFSRETDASEYLLILDHFDFLPQYSDRGLPLAELIAYEITEMLQTCPNLRIAVLLTENERCRYFPKIISSRHWCLQEQEQIDELVLKQYIDSMKQPYRGISFGFDSFSVQFILEFIIPLAVQKSSKAHVSNTGYRITCSAVTESLKALSNPASTIYSPEARMRFNNYTNTNDPRINIASVSRRLCMAKSRAATAKRVLDFCRSIGILVYRNKKLCFVSSEVYDYFRSMGERISEWV